MAEQSSASPMAAPIAPLSAADATRPGPNWLKWSLGCAGIGMVLFTGVAMLFLIVLPVAFRSLLPEQQAQILKHAPFMAAFMPTRAYAPDTLPTVQAANGTAAMALLTGPIGVSTETPTATLTPTVTKTPLVSFLASVTATGDTFGAATPTFQPSATLQPSPTGLPTATSTNIPTATLPPIPSSYHENGIKWVLQGWNDCGPANITQALEYYGWTGTVDEAVAALKPNHEDRNVSPWEMVRFVNQHTGVRAITRVAGDLSLIKRLVADKFAVIMETGYNVAGEGWAGHYLTVLGYDDNLNIVFGGDTNLGFGPDGLGQREDYTDLDNRWREFNRRYIVVYSKEREPELAAILGADADPSQNAVHALTVARAEAKAMPDNAFTWFNIGSSLTMLGQYQAATVAFDQSRNTGTQVPFRMLWYQFTPYEAYYNAGNYAQVMSLVQATLGTTPFVEETWYWRGLVEAAQGQTDAALKDFDSVIKFNPGFTSAADAMARVKAGTFVPPTQNGGFARTEPSQ
ncbi:MAG: C39 family peptidase [Aggregatilineales bacterium]